MADFRYWCTQSFWFFNRFCLSFGQLLCGEPDNVHFGKPWPDHPWVFQRCQELQRDPDDQLHLWPRFSFKCLSADTLVYRSDGEPLRVGDLSPGDRVMGLGSDWRTRPVKVLATKDQGVTECWKVTLCSGDSITATPNHPLMVGYEWKQASQIEPGDLVAVPRKLRRHCPVATISVDEMAFLGFMMADGACTRCSWTNAESDVVERFRAVCERLGCSLSEPSGYDYRVRGAARFILRQHDQFGKKSTEKRMTADMLSQPDDRLEAFLRAFWSCDGWVSKTGSAGITLACEGLIDDLRKVCASLGIFSSKYVMANDFAGSWILDVTDQASLRRLREIGVGNDRKQDRLKRVLAAKQHERGDSIADGWSKALSSPPQSRRFRRAGLRHQPGAYRSTARGKVHAYALADENPELLALADGDIRWNPVKSVERVEPQRTVDIEVEGGVFIAGGIVSHNTSLITQNLTMWEWIRDVKPPLDGTALRTLILTYKRDKTGEAMLLAIKMEVEKNELLRAHWPDLFYPDPKQSGEWGAGGLRIKQRGNPRESTVTVAGLDSMPTSQHYDRIIYDDPVVRETVRTPEQIHSTVEAMRQSVFLRADDTKVRYVGTRWKMGDPWAHWMKQDLFRVNHQDCYDKNGDAVLRSRKFWDKFKKDAGPYEFSAQCRGNPLADDNKRFQLGWLKTYEREPDEERFGKNVYILIDPARSQKKTSDYTVFWVIGLGADRNYYCLDLYRERLSVPDFIELLFDLVTVWKPIKVFEEVFGANRDVEHIRERQKTIGYRFDIEEIPEVRMPKEERIEALMAPMSDGRFFFPKGGFGHTAKGDHRDTMAIFREDEYEDWTPAGSTMHDDMLDCLANILLDKMKMKLRWPVRRVSDSYDRGRKLGRSGGRVSGGGRTAWSW